MCVEEDKKNEGNQEVCFKKVQNSAVFVDNSKNKKDIKIIINGPLLPTDTKKILEFMQPSSNINGIQSLIDISSTDVGSSLNDEYNNIIDTARDLIEGHKSKQALSILENLKKKLIDKTDINHNVKFRIITNIGAASLDLGDTLTAAEHFIEAYQYAEDLEKAKINKALGLMLLKEKDEDAKKILDDVLKNNPTSKRAISLSVQLISNIVDLENYIKDIPEALLKEQEIAMAIGSTYLKIGNHLEDAEIWYNMALKTKEPDINVLGTLAETKVQLVLKNNTAVSGQQANKEQRKKLESSIDLFTECIDKIKDTDLYKTRHPWINSRGIAYNILRRVTEAELDFREALRLCPDEAMYQKNIILILLQTNRFKEALDLIEEIEKEDIVADDIFVLKAQILIQNGQTEDAVEILKQIYKTSQENFHKVNSGRLLVEIYLDQDDIEQAKKLNEEMLSDNPTNILPLLDTIKILKKQNDTSETEIIFQRLLKYLDANADFMTKKELADILFFNQKYSDAWPIYESIVDIHIESDVRYRFLFSLYKSGEYKKALENISTIKETGHTRYTVEIESAIFEEIGDNRGAYNTLKEYTEKNSGDFEISLSFAMHNFRQDNFKELDRFLQTHKNFLKSTPENIFKLAFLLQDRGFQTDALELVFQVWRSNQNNPEVLSNYFYFFVELENKDTRDNVHLLRPIEKISIGDVVTIQYISEDKKKTFILIDEDTTILSEEITVSSKLGKELLNKRKGDKFTIGKLAEEVEIIDIQNKYIYALQKTQEHIAEKRGDIDDIVSFKINLDDNGQDFKEKMKKMMPDREKQESINNLLELYKEKSLPIGALSTFIGKDYFDLFNLLIRTPALGIKCSNGTLQERNSAISQLSGAEKTSLVIDLSSLFTIFSLEIEDEVAQNYPEIIVANSVKQFISYQFQNYKKGMKNKQRGSAYQNEYGEIIYEEISEKNVEENKNRLEKIKNWLDEKCIVIPSTGSLLIKHEQKEKLTQILGWPQLETIIISGQKEKNILFSDDLALRLLAQSEFHTEGVWTQIILMDLLDKKILDQDKYSKAILGLLKRNFHYTTINENIVMYALEQDNWHAGDENMKALFQVLNANHSNPDSIIDIILKTYFQLSKKLFLDDFRRNTIMIKLFDNFFRGYKDENELINLMKGKIKVMFKLTPLLERDIVSIIEQWRNTKRSIPR